MVARGFSQVTIDNATESTRPVLGAAGNPAWEATPDDIDRVVGVWAAAGMAASTRRGYVQAFKDFHGSWSPARRPRSRRPSGSVGRARSMSSTPPVMSATTRRRRRPPPTPERMEEFFDFLRDRVATARKFAPAGRDYALFRTLYHAGLRAEEAVALELSRPALRPGPVRQAACPLRQGCHDVGSAASVGADAGPAST